MAEERDEDIVIKMTLEDGLDVDCNIIVIFEANEKEYFALEPQGDNFDEGTVWIYENANPDWVEEDDIELIVPADDEEYVSAVNAFYEWADEYED
jgi:hypothetical protein